METKKKPNIIKLPDGTEYDVDVLSELSKDDQLVKLKEKLFWEHVNRRGGIEIFMKHLDELDPKSSKF
jgi:hypothetical protein